MGLAAQLYQDAQDARRAERFPIGFDATLRDPAHVPLDVVVEDISATGFRMITDADLAAGADIRLGLAGIGVHRAQIVWHANGIYGCAFVTPLTSADLNIALSAPSSAPVTLPGVGPSAQASFDADVDEQPVRKLPPPVRLLVIVALAITAWIVTITLGAAVFRALTL
jgi:hypothetical protein